MTGFYSVSFLGRYGLLGEFPNPSCLLRSFRNGATTSETNAFQSDRRLNPALNKQSNRNQSRAADSLATMNEDVHAGVETLTDGGEEFPNRIM